MKVKVLKNYPWDHLKLAKKPLAIKEGDPEWAQAYATWLSGKNPTSDPAWKEGVYMELEDLS